jgi:hypothetical protein
LPAFFSGHVIFGIIAAFNTLRVKKYQSAGVKTDVVFFQVFPRLAIVPYDLALFMF